MSALAAADQRDEVEDAAGDVFRRTVATLEVGTPCAGTAV
jgi:hypothetical protein